MFHARRVSDFKWFTRAYIRLWLAQTHGWRTRWAAFDWYVTAEIDGRQVSIAGVVDRRGAVGCTPARLGLLGGVFTLPRYRRKGMASAVVQHSTRLIVDELKCNFGVLICSDKLVPFYQRLGWRLVANEMVYERFSQRGVVDINVMVYEFAGRPLPPGPIDVVGLPA